MDSKNRLRLAVLLNFNPSWLGGVYYIINIVKTLRFLDDDQRPEVLLFYNPELERFVGELDYPFVKLIPWQFASIPSTLALSLIKLRNERIHAIEKRYSPDAIFPVGDLVSRPCKPVGKRPVLVSWYADLQHKFYPEFFKKTELLGREVRTRLMLRNTDKLVLSSSDSESHFRRSYAIRKGFSIEIYRFVSVVDDFHFLSGAELSAKYGVPGNYFLVSNQFLLNKNHKVVLNALNYLKETGKEAHIVMTGAMFSKRFPGFIRELKNYVANHQLEPLLTLVGVIPRKDQLSLMYHSRAVIQPSLFEGWSTVIEDARSLQVPVIASDLQVNIEQLGDKGRYFSPHDYKTLAELMLQTPDRTHGQMIYEPYEDRMRNAARNFVGIFQKP